MSDGEGRGRPRVAGAGAEAGAPPPVLAGDLAPGVLLLGAEGEVTADPRALALLGGPDPAGLAAWWAAARPLLAKQGVDLDVPAGGAPSGAAELLAPGHETGGPGERGDIAVIGGIGGAGGPGNEAAHGAGGAGGAPGFNGRRLRVAPACGRVLLLFDKTVESSLEQDLLAASQLRSLAQVTPAVAHDLRAPINAMVLNLEVLKETLAAHPASVAPAPQPAPPPRAGQPGPRDPRDPRDPRERQLRYVNVLREELSRLHRSLELYLAHVTPRGDRLEVLDLREPAQDLAALLRPPAHKQQVRIAMVAPDDRLPVSAQRFPLRQALLHLGLAVLSEVPSGGMLEIRLERPEDLPERVRIRIAAVPPAGWQAAAPPAAGAGAGRPVRFSAAGTEARQEVAESLLALFGGTARRVAGERPRAAAAGGEGATEGAGSGDGPPGAVAATEIEFPLSRSN